MSAFRPKAVIAGVLTLTDVPTIFSSTRKTAVSPTARSFGDKTGSSASNFYAAIEQDIVSTGAVHA
jgi:hypothetical protein